MEENWARVSILIVFAFDFMVASFFSSWFTAVNVAP
jgi:hypothetical protein